MMQSLMLDCVAKGPRDRLLACYFVKRLRTPLARDYLIGHVERSCVPLAYFYYFSPLEIRCFVFLQQLPEQDRAAVRVDPHDLERDQHV